VETPALTSAVLLLVYLTLQLVKQCKAGVLYCLEEPADSARNAVPETAKHGGNTLKTILPSWFCQRRR
jgi:hypothetical protein